MFLKQAQNFFEKIQTSKKRRMSSSSSSSSSSVGGTSQPLTLNSIPPEILANIGLFLTPAERANARLIGRYQSGVFSRQPLKVFRVTVRKSFSRMKRLFTKRLKHEFALFTDSTGNVKPEDMAQFRKFNYTVFMDPGAISPEAHDRLMDAELYPELVNLRRRDFFIFYDLLYTLSIQDGGLEQYRLGNSLFTFSSYRTPSAMNQSDNQFLRLLQTSSSGKSHMTSKIINVLHDYFLRNGHQLGYAQTLGGLEDIISHSSRWWTELGDGEDDDEEGGEFYKMVLQTIINNVHQMGGTEAQKLRTFNRLWEVELSEEILCEKFTVISDDPLF
jgi:hypothetical protein